MMNPGAVLKAFAEIQIELTFIARAIVATR